MGIWKLRLSMLGTLALIFGSSTLVFAAILMLFGSSLSILTIGIFITIFYFAQWLLSPYLVGAIYKTRKYLRHKWATINYINSLTIKKHPTPPFHISNKNPPPPKKSVAKNITHKQTTHIYISNTKSIINTNTCKISSYLT
jgi:hypothetical protein